MTYIVLSLIVVSIAIGLLVLAYRRGWWEDSFDKEFYDELDEFVRNPLLFKRSTPPGDATPGDDTSDEPPGE